MSVEFLDLIRSHQARGLWQFLTAVAATHVMRGAVRQN